MTLLDINVKYWQDSPHSSTGQQGPSKQDLTLFNGSIQCFHKVPWSLPGGVGSERAAGHGQVALESGQDHCGEPGEALLPGEASILGGLWSRT